MTSHNQTESGTEALQTQAECKYKFVLIELVIYVSTHWISNINLYTEYDIKWISLYDLEFEKKQSLKIDPGTYKKSWEC